MEKSPDAFRTISEVAELLETPAHVLRFWESRFPQIRPVKRAGGRRYYRPADVALLTGIKRLLHDDGMTIRGVQKILREQGVKHVSGVAEDAGADDDAALEAALAALGKESAHVVPQPQAEVESAQIIALETALKPAAPPEDKTLEEAAEDAPPH
jgi:DNA-binding transcriptional MerR regulator